MVEVAARLGPRIDWTVGMLATLPVDDGTVDVWCCQQGLQFVPDQAAVLVEARRVLVPGGRIGVAVWCGAADNPAFDAFADALGEVVSDEAAASMRAPFAFGDREGLRDLLAGAGFTEVTITLVASRRGSPRAASCFARRWRSSPLADVVYEPSAGNAGKTGCRARTSVGPPHRRRRCRGADADLASRRSAVGGRSPGS